MAADRQAGSIADGHTQSVKSMHGLSDERKRFSFEREEAPNGFGGSSLLSTSPEEGTKERKETPGSLAVEESASKFLVGSGRLLWRCGEWRLTIFERPSWTLRNLAGRMCAANGLIS